MARKRAIPLVDLSDFTKGDEASKKAFIKKLSKAFHEIGFVGVVNHGIPKALVNKFYAESQAFFMLPTEKKQKYEVPGLAGQRGYTSFGKEHAKQSKVGDLKEFFQIGQEVKGKDPIKKEYPKNVYVRERPQYLATGIKLYQSFERSGGKLLKAIAIHLGLGEKYFDPKIKNGNSILRSIYYPPITAKDEIVINVGDMLQRLTNNYLKSTTHRVVNPPKEDWHKPRLSIPFFLHPRSEMDLSCLGKTVTKDNPLHYPPITAGDYLAERLREIGLKK